MNKHILTLLTTLSIAILAGCASDPASVNTNVVATETQKQNENAENVNENTKSESVKYESDRMVIYGINFSFPEKYISHQSGWFTKIELEQSPYDTWATISVLDSYTLKRHERREYINWDYFLDLQPIDIAHIRGYTPELTWEEFHAVKDTFRPNAIISGIPMYIRTQHYPVLIDTYLETDVQNLHFYEAYFFIHDGLNLVRVVYPYAQGNHDYESTDFFDPSADIRHKRNEFQDLLASISVNKKRGIIDNYTLNLLGKSKEANPQIYEFPVLELMQ